MKIVEYNHKYAEQVAQMWNKSGPNWGNDEIFRTKEDVIESESKSGNINLFLAIDNEQVVGYCSFSEYQHDEGASYLPLLNVIPEYHGKKVGKALILRVLEEAKKSNWSRFDLFTWSGNIKAMPLYKKCGFFWERKNDTVHLMNFLPYLYQTEALKEYLGKIDTYKDNKRVIDMEHDGREENGFDFYRYDFRNSEIELSCEFERTGRGLTYLNTPDYEIKMNIHEHDLVYNEQYEVSFDILNKNNEPLKVSFIGKNNKNIRFEKQEDLTIKSKGTVTGQYFVGPIVKDQDNFMTHPVIEADIYVDGKKVTFKTGIEPKHPVTLKLRSTGFSHVLNKNYTAYLDIENNLPTKEDFVINIPNTFVEFEKNLHVTLSPKEKRSIKVDFTLLDYGFYKEEALVTYKDKVLKQTVFVGFKGATQSFIGELQDVYYIASGNYIVYLNTKNNNVGLINEFNGDPDANHLTPQLGKPYNLEFSNQVPKVEIINENHITATYISNTFDGIELVRHIKHMFGVCEVYFELKNTKEQRDISLNIPLWTGLENNCIPYSNKLLYVPSKEEVEVGELDASNVDENWFYNFKHRSGLYWEEGITMQVNDWKLTFSVEDITLKQNDTFKTKSIYTTYVHKDVKTFREFVGSTEEKEVMSFIELNVNNGNPFITDQAVVSVVNNKKAPLKGMLEVDKQSVDINQSLTVSEGIVHVRLSLEDRYQKMSRLLIKQGGTIKMTEESDTLIVDNGLLQFKASNTYADSVYSLVFNNQEYLDSNYPTPKERAWWGDFVGGITQRINGLQDISSLKEKRNVEFTTITDNYGSTWKGIKTTLEVEKDPVLKGLKMETYTVTLPNVPVVYSFAKVTNNIGKLMSEKGFSKYNVLHIDDQKDKVLIQNGSIEYKCNDKGFEYEPDKLVYYTNSREYNLAIYNPKNKLFAGSQKEYNILFSQAKLTIPDQESKLIPGDFFIFTKETLKKEYLKDFKNIKFEV